MVNKKGIVRLKLEREFLIESKQCVWREMYIKFCDTIVESITAYIQRYGKQQNKN